MELNILVIVALQVLLVLALVLLNGFFVAAEFAIVKIRDTQLETLIVKGHKRARRARHIISHLDAYLSATQLGITIASLALGWVGHPIFNYLLQPVMNGLGIESPQLRHTLPVVVGFSVITFLHIVVGELAPKSLAIQKPLPTSLWISGPLLWFYKISYPFIWLLNGAALWLLRRLGIQPASEAELSHSEEELRLLIGSSQVHAGASALGRAIVLNALDLRRRIAREVMRPRREMVPLNTAAPISQCVFTAESTRYSRFPLCEDGDLDKTLGVVHFKDLFALRLSARTGADLRSVVRPLIYVPETARLERLLQFFLERKLHMAVVVDEFGGTVGLVTLENILEELVGPIQDEFDQEKALLHQLDPDTWILDGALPLHELEELVGETLPGEGITTTSGWVTQKVAGFPKAGDVLTLSGYELRVEEVADMRVSRLRLARKPKGEEEPQ